MFENLNDPFKFVLQEKFKISIYSDSDRPWWRFTQLAKPLKC